MQTLRNAHLIARLVLVWFALSVGVALASPIVKPQGVELICSASGLMKLLVKTDDGAKVVSLHTLDCSLCASGHAPPPSPMSWNGEPVPALAHVLPGIAAAPAAALTAAPLPARGPPAFLNC